MKPKCRFHPPQAMPQNLVASLAFVVLLARPCLAATIPSYTFLNLGSLGQPFTQAVGINSSGEVIGYSEVATNIYHAFRTAPNSAINPATDDLGTLGGTGSTAYAINDAGEVVGQSSLPNGQPVAFRTAPNQPINPATDSLGTLGGNQSAAYAINNLGQVTGFAETATSYFPFRTGPNGPINPAADSLGTLGGKNGKGYGINDSGQVVGYAQIPSFLNDAFRTAPNSPINPATDNLSPNGASQCTAAAINASGQVVGQFDSAAGTLAYRTEPNSPINPLTDSLGALGGVSSNALAINSAGDVVGYFINVNLARPVHAFYFDGSNMMDLNGLTNVPIGSNLQQATGINDRGQIVGWGQNALSQNFAFLLTPVPEPSSLLMLAIGGLALGGATLRRRLRT